jgi:hypothetical protein
MMELLPDWCALQQASIMSSEVMGKNDYWIAEKIHELLKIQ